MRREPDDARKIAILILIGAATLFTLVIVIPVIALLAAQSMAKNQALHRLQTYRREIERQPQLEARLAALRSRETSAAGLVAGKSEALAAANIENLVKPQVESNGGQVRSVQSLPAMSSGNFEKVGVQYDISVPMARLRALTYQLETDIPFLFLDDVDIRMSESWQMEGNIASAPNLEIRWTVAAYRWMAAP